VDPGHRALPLTVGQRAPRSRPTTKAGMRLSALSTCPGWGLVVMHFPVTRTVSDKLVWFIHFPVPDHLLQQHKTVSDRSHCREGMRC
jgi:hypothetical protein